MPIETNINGDQIAYDYPYADTLNEDEKELYWSATQRAEDALSRIWKVQESRIDENGDINYDLLDDEFCKLREAMEVLKEAITYLHLIIKASDWSERMEEGQNSLLEQMEAGEELGENTNE